jgi:hypothetical protein
VRAVLGEIPYPEWYPPSCSIKDWQEMLPSLFMRYAPVIERGNGRVRSGDLENLGGTA